MSKDYQIKLIDEIYNQIPAFTDLFDEETWYLFVGCFVMTTFIVVFIASRFVTIKAVD